MPTHLNIVLEDAGSFRGKYTDNKSIWLLEWMGGGGGGGEFVVQHTAIVCFIEQVASPPYVIPCSIDSLF